jgi:Transposase DDE domain group 1
MARVIVWRRSCGPAIYIVPRTGTNCSCPRSIGNRCGARKVVFRADAAFAKPEIYEALEERGVKYAIRIPADDGLERDIAKLLTRPKGRPSHKPVAWYKGFLYRAASWKAARRAELARAKRIP